MKREPDPKLRSVADLWALLLVAALLIMLGCGSLGVIALWLWRVLEMTK